MQLHSLIFYRTNASADRAVSFAAISASEGKEILLSLGFDGVLRVFAISTGARKVWKHAIILSNVNAYGQMGVNLSKIFFILSFEW